MKAYLEVINFNVADVITASVECANPQNGINATTPELCEGCDGD